MLADRIGHHGRDDMAIPTQIRGPVVSTHDLRRTFKSRGGPVEAVRGVDLEVRAGEIFGFLGANGGGEARTVRMRATLLTPTAGTAPVAGPDLIREPQLVRRRIG